MQEIVLDWEYSQMVLDLLSSQYANVATRIWRHDLLVIGVFVYEEYVKRTGTYQTLTTVVESDEIAGRCTVTVYGSGGGKGLFNFDWGSQSDGEYTIIRRVNDLVGN